MIISRKLQMAMQSKVTKNAFLTAKSEQEEEMDVSPGSYMYRFQSQL